MGNSASASPYGDSAYAGATGSGVSLLKLACDHTTADAAILATVPAGHRARINRVYWENTTAWTGGTNAAIGASSSNASYNTKGDLQGGAGGDLTAAMGAGFKGGSAAGAKMTGVQVVVLTGGDTIRFDRIADNYAAGAGYLCVELVEMDDGSDS